MKRLAQDEERIGSYATKRKAMQFVRNYTRCTGMQHRAVKTRTWRNLEERECWTVQAVTE